MRVRVCVCVYSHTHIHIHTYTCTCVLIRRRPSHQASILHPRASVTAGLSPFWVPLYQILLSPALLSGSVSSSSSSKAACASCRTRPVRRTQCARNSKCGQHVPNAASMSQRPSAHPTAHTCSLARMCSLIGNGLYKACPQLIQQHTHSR